MIILCKYTYDPLDRVSLLTPLAQAVSRRFYNGERLMTELQGETQRTFVRVGGHLLAQQSRENGGITATLIAGDRHSSVLHASNAGQRADIAYSPYGHHDAASPIEGLPGFNGEQPDRVTGHYLLGNGYRAYNPMLMRFNSPDSLSPFGRGGLNAYAYCAGDPVSQTDPTGHFPFMLPRLSVVSGAAGRAMSAGSKTLGRLRAAVGKRFSMHRAGGAAKTSSQDSGTPNNAEFMEVRKSMLNRKDERLNRVDATPESARPGTTSQVQNIFESPQVFLDAVSRADYVSVSGQWFQRFDGLPEGSNLNLNRHMIDVRVNGEGHLQVLEVSRGNVIREKSYEALTVLR
ncbi:RHS repeat-associated core domain-containing protein [Pseudomonas syringae]|uniref:YD repeat protein n=4 Tax=Pseudomonas syringae TaxID=317 RepID=A0A3M4L367_PSESF|nr:RHS repeat-associated core domain-containing protein [Pseudomonas syringae]EPM49734.1 hypothetical protein A246_07003 [Pseudomonas syringae pv. actinidiae ICMP 19098]EPN13450.1 hypothetical protein A249_10497 [Pseudomonas syringae pv. actinidiae ICMP 18804]EPN20238.1 hypothetical protein A248_07142 [Pseudomonas syringae pv. actinidiae ICMP 19100]EPN59046.1 hypothetical protein A244_09405 [Pseudomonas syringae pv. actinidiae ICMP 18807]MDU8431414.1 RHS repeat-associated core domain-containin